MTLRTDAYALPTYKFHASTMLLLSNMRALELYACSGLKKHRICFS